jgi:SOS-response transcriptional repressor LexA
MSTLGERMKKARLEARLSQEALADAISRLIDNKKISRTAVTQWESSKTKGIEASNLLKATKVLNVTPDWLQFGHGNMRPNDNSNFSSCVSVPLLNYFQTDNAMEKEKEIVSHVGLDERLAKIASRGSFALVMQDNSMAPVFMPGDIVIIDPEIKPQPGEFVAVRLTEDKECVIFRKYRPLPGNGSLKFELVALNEDWSKTIINDKNAGEIIGTLIEHRCRRRIHDAKDFMA